MTRLIDADALLDEIKEMRKFENIHQDIQDEYKHIPEVLLRNNLSAVEIINIITNAPTVQREGWVSVPIEPTKEMLEAVLNGTPYVDDNKQLMREAYKAMISAAPSSINVVTV